MDRILLNRQEERYFYEFLRIAGNKTPRQCAEEISAHLGTRSADDVLRFYGQTVEIIFKGQKGALEGFSDQRTHRILTKFYDQKVLPLYGASEGGEASVGRKGRSKNVKAVGAGVETQVGMRKKSVNDEEVVQEVSSGNNDVRSDERKERNERNQLDATTSTPEHRVAKTFGSYEQTAQTNVSRDRRWANASGNGAVQVVFVPFEESLATRLTQCGFDPCPRMALDVTESVLGMVERLAEGWKKALEGFGCGDKLRVLPPDDAPLVLRGCAWGDPARDGGLLLGDVLEAMGAWESLGSGGVVTLGFAFEAGTVCYGRGEPRTQMREERRDKETGRKKRKTTAVKATADTNGSSEKENTANKSISFDAGQQGGPASFGSPAFSKDSSRQRQQQQQQHAGATENANIAAKGNARKTGASKNPKRGAKANAKPMAADELKAKIENRQPVGLRNQIKHEPKLKARNKRKNPDKSSAVSGQESEQLLRNATELIAADVREQLAYDMMVERERENAFAFGAGFAPQKEDMSFTIGAETRQFIENNLQVAAGAAAAGTKMTTTTTTPSRNKKASKVSRNKKARVSSEDIMDLRDLVGCSPPSSFKPQINSNEPRPAGGAAAKSLNADFNQVIGLGNRSQVGVFVYSICALAVHDACPLTLVARRSVFTTGRPDGHFRDHEPCAVAQYDRRSVHSEQQSDDPRQHAPGDWAEEHRPPGGARRQDAGHVAALWGRGGHPAVGWVPGRDEFRGRWRGWRGWRGWRWCRQGGRQH